LLVGEVVGAQRAALDHIVYAASITETRSSPKGTGFPIYTDNGKYEREGRSRIKFCPPAVQAVVDEAQPFRRADVGREEDIGYAPLAVLNALVNADKHRVTPVLLTSTFGGGWIKPQGLLTEDWGGGPVVDQAVIARFTFAVPTDPGEVNPFFFFELRFPDGDPGLALPVRSTLGHIQEIVAEVLTKVEGAMAGKTHTEGTATGSG
jgi:hypothetical protein